MKQDDLATLVADQPERFTDLVAALSGLVQGQNASGLKTCLDTALSAVIRPKDHPDASRISLELQHRINCYPQPCVCVGADGIIKAANAPASLALPIKVSKNIDHAGFVSDTGDRLSTHIKRILQDRTTRENIPYLRCMNPASQKTATFAILPAWRGDNSGNDALVFIIDPKWTHGMRDRVAELYSLTEAELDILFLFLDGLSIDEVAKARARSRATIRTQFNTILNKCGIQRQTDLMRELLLSLSFSGHVRPLERSAGHPNQREFQILRPQGRCVDLLLAGDLAGDLAIYLTVPCIHGFSARIEAEFRAARLCVASLARPGFGRTDPPPPGETVMDCLMGDIEAVLAQMNKQAVTLIASRNSMLAALEFAARFPHRVRNILSLNTQPPKFFYDQCAMQYGSPVMQSAEAANQCSPDMLAFVLKSAISAWATMGTRRYANIAYETVRPSANQADEVDQRKMFEEGLETSTRQGLDAVIADFPGLLSDWRDKLEVCSAPITILHGTADKIYPIEPIRAMRDAYPDKITVEEIEGADRLLYVTHCAIFVETIRKLAAP